MKQESRFFRFNHVSAICKIQQQHTCHINCLVCQDTGLNPCCGHIIFVSEILEQVSSSNNASASPETIFWVHHFSGPHSYVGHHYLIPGSTSSLLCIHPKWIGMCSNSWSPSIAPYVVMPRDKLSIPNNIIYVPVNVN